MLIVRSVDIHESEVTSGTEGAADSSPVRAVGGFQL